MKRRLASVTSKGQLVIPARVRRKYGIKKGTRVAIVEEENRIVLQPLTPEFLRSLTGWLKGKPSALDYLLKERKKDRFE